MFLTLRAPSICQKWPTRPFSGNDNFPFNQNSQTRSVKSWMVCTKGDGFWAKTLGKSHFIFKLTGRAMVRPASSDKWKAPLVIPFTANNSLRTQTYLRSSLLSSVFAGYADKSQSKKIYIKIKTRSFVSENHYIWIATPFRILSADARVRMSNNLPVNQSRREMVTVPL